MERQYGLVINRYLSVKKECVGLFPYHERQTSVIAEMAPFSLS